MICLFLIFCYVSREYTSRINCSSNLHQIYLALNNYSVGYAGNYPPVNGAAGLEILRKNGYLTDYVTCPSTKTTQGKNNQEFTEENTDYVYTGGLNQKSDPKLPLVYDKAKNHGNYFGNVLFVDGTVIVGNPWTANIKK